jgi:hypothetical protein
MEKIDLIQSVVLPISDLETNKGQIDGLSKNPRFIRDERYSKLKRSIEENPEMLALRECLVFPHGGKYVIIGGNMRYRAQKELGYTEIVCKIIPPQTPVDDLRAYTIKDNAGFGEWDFDALANEWNPDDLLRWCIDIPNIDVDLKKQFVEEITENQSEKGNSNDFFNSMLTDCIYESNNEFEIPNLLIEKQAGKLELPFSPWGADTRAKKDIATYHFYVEDYRFEAIWKNPDKVLASGVKSIVEPNLSLFDTTPIAYGLHQIYKKRWISRYFQECGILVYAELNVSKKFKEYNKMGIPKEYNAFFTRGYSDRLEYLKEEFDIAKEISGLQTPNLIVYGGGKFVQKFCMENSLVYVEQFMQNK